MMMMMMMMMMIFEMVTDTNMKKTEKSMGTHKVYPEIFHLCSISCSANVNATFEFFSYAPQLRLIDIGHGL
jgi:hypothetical protein